MITKD
jgi:hypothetical protein